MTLPVPSDAPGSAAAGVGLGTSARLGGIGGNAPAAPSTIASLRGVSAHGLVSLERAEGILQRVIDTVNEQALQISSLFLLVQTLVTTAGPGGGEGMRLPRCGARVVDRLTWPVACSSSHPSIHRPDLLASILPYY